MKKKRFFALLTVGSIAGVAYFKFIESKNKGLEIERLVKDLKLTELRLDKTLKIKINNSENGVCIGQKINKQEEIPKIAKINYLLLSVESLTQANLFETINLDLESLKPGSSNEFSINMEEFLGSQSMGIYLCSSSKPDINQRCSEKKAKNITEKFKTKVLNHPLGSLTFIPKYSPSDNEEIIYFQNIYIKDNQIIYPLITKLEPEFFIDLSQYEFLALDLKSQLKERMLYVVGLNQMLHSPPPTNTNGELHITANFNCLNGTR